MVDDNFSTKKNSAKLFVLSLTTVVVFFICLEVSLRVLGYQPHIYFQNIQLPYWISRVDPIFLNDYKHRLKTLGKVNQDLYAYRPDPIFGNLLKPNYKRKIAGYSSVFPVDNMPQWTLISGEDGFRVGSHEEQAKNKRFPGGSVFILGDSSSFGWGVDFENTYGFVFTDIINRSLKPGEASYRVVNRSMPGLSTFGGLKAVRQMNDIKPGDWVLISLGSNDHAPASITDLQRSVYLQSTSEKLRKELEKFLLYKMFRSAWVSFRVSFNHGIKLPVNRVSIDEYNKNLRNIFDTIGSHGGKPVFINICNFKKYASVALELTNSTGTPFIDFIKQVRPFFNEIPKRFPKIFMRYFDAYGEKMEENELYAVLFPDGCHPNAIGHRLLGEILFESLERKPGKTSEPGRKTG